MKKQKNIFLSALLLMAALFAGCSKHTDMYSASPDDPEMNAAIAKARETLPQFWQSFEHPKPGESDYALKVKITDKNGTEHFWVIDLQRKDGKIFGTINNDPEMVKNVKMGDRIEIPEPDISDWLFIRNQKMAGNYTLRVELKRAPKEEAEKYKAMLENP
jgi:uncharacterized protein YegJ (DUF2314 family)